MQPSILLFILCCFQISFSQTYSGPIAKPVSGFGADGSFTVSNTSVTNPLHSEAVQVYYPTEATTAVPTIFFAHGFSLSSPINYIGFINFMVSKGYAVAFAPYPLITSGGVTRYQVLQAGFEAAATNLTSTIDTSKVGFVGHSFGAGALYAIANDLITNSNWGNSASFLMPIAQWYSLNISQTELQNFNTSTKLLSIIAEDESVTDHRMSIDMFRNIAIANSEKDIAYVSTDIVSGYTYTADHLTSLTNSSFDALDYYAIYRLFDALADYTFTGNAAAKNVALGNGSTEQTQMPTGMTSLQVNDAMNPQFPESTYQSACTSALNPRSSFCAALSLNEAEVKTITFSPNPTKRFVTIQTHQNNLIERIEIYDLLGKQVYFEINNSNYANLQIDLNVLNQGVYLLKIVTGNYVITKKLIKN